MGDIGQVQRGAASEDGDGSFPIASAADLEAARTALESAAQQVWVDPATGQWWIPKQYLDRLRQAPRETPPPPPPSPPRSRQVPEPAPEAAPEPQLTYKKALDVYVRTGTQSALQALMATVTESGADLVQADVDRYLALTLLDTPKPPPALVQGDYLAGKPPAQPPKASPVWALATLLTAVMLLTAIIITLAFPT